MNNIEFPVNLYCTSVTQINTIDLSRGDDDFRKVYIVDDGNKKFVIKQASNAFTDMRRIEGWFRLMEAYRTLGIYCPRIITNLQGNLITCYGKNGRNYYVFAEEFAKYETAENIGRDKLPGENGNPSFLADVMRSLGKVAAARLDVVDWPSCYCLLEPHSPPDTVDEATECAEIFAEYIKRELPEFREKMQLLLDLFYKNKDALSEIYPFLPTSCFQADLNDSNILLNEDNKFVGLIDFNLCGREPVLNYTVREALWGVDDSCLYGDNGSRLYFYDPELDDIRNASFLKNIKHVQEYYKFNEIERDAFPILFRYINSFWWHHIHEIEQIKNDREKVSKLLDWLAWQMTRDDIRLP